MKTTGERCLAPKKEPIRAEPIKDKTKGPKEAAEGFIILLLLVGGIDSDKIGVIMK